MKEPDPGMLDNETLRRPPVRALHRAVRVPDAQSPYDTLHARVFYPAAFSGDAQQRNTGEIPCDVRRGPFPIVMLLGGINLAPQGYGWLAQHLASQGLVCVTFSYVAEVTPGNVGLSPGLDIEHVKPGRYGELPSATAVAPLLADLRTLNERGPILKDQLRLDEVVLGGHSAGGTVALLNAGMFDEVRAVFTYGAHSGVSTMLGYPPNTVLPIGGDRPILLLGGTDDGVIAASTQRYGDPNASADARLRQTFAEAMSGGRNDQHLVLVRAANHLSLVHPLDPTSGRAFLEDPAQTPDALRRYLGELITAFACAHTRVEDAAWATRARTTLAELLDPQHPHLAASQTK